MAVDAAKAGTPPSPPDRPPPLPGVPWDVAQDAMRPEAVVIVAGVARVLAVHAQDERRKQVPDPAGKLGGVGGGSGARRDGGRERAKASRRTQPIALRMKNSFSGSIGAATWANSAKPPGPCT